MPLPPPVRAAGEARLEAERADDGPVAVADFPEQFAGRRFPQADFRVGSFDEAEWLHLRLAYF